MVPRKGVTYGGDPAHQINRDILSLGNIFNMDTFATYVILRHVKNKFAVELTSYIGCVTFIYVKLMAF